MSVGLDVVEKSRVESLHIIHDVCVELDLDRLELNSNLSRSSPADTS